MRESGDMGAVKDHRVPLRIADWVSAGRTITCGMEYPNISIRDFVLNMCQKYIDSYSPRGKFWALPWTFPIIA
jgi:hypothetical protein